MQQISQSLLSILHDLNHIPEHIIEPMDFIPEFVKEPLVESLSLVPFLFVLFILIEIFEQFFTKKRHLFVFFMKKIGPLFGSIFASIPQCGFSVIASTLYTRRILSRGTLLAVYFATSDEAIPILISNPDKVYLILPILILKILIAIIVGYLVDLLISYKAKEPSTESTSLKHSKGCCHHKLSDAIKSKNFWLHPVKHTFNIFLFILAISIGLSFLLHQTGTEENLAKYCLMNSPIQPFMGALIGLIPNCAISVMLTILYIKHTITFGTLIAGLSSAGGLGVIVLLKHNNDKKDTALILSLMIIVSTIIGLILQYNIFGINKIFEFFGIKI